MKARYVFLLGFLSLVINGISLYNLLIGYVSFFIILVVLIPNIFIKIIELGKKAKAKGANNILIKDIMDFDKNTHSKGIYIFGIIFVYTTGIGLGIFQIYQYEYINNLVMSNITTPIFYTVVPYLVGAGYILFVLSLIAMVLHFRKLFCEASMFQKNDQSKYLET